MTIQELRIALLREHRRDVRLTNINIAIIAFIALLIIGLVVYLIKQSGGTVTGAISNTANDVNYSSLPKYLQIVIPVAILCMLGTLYFSWRKIKNRPQEIEKFVNYIENGTKIVSITETKEYKINLPLLVVHYHTGAVKKFSMSLNGVKKTFSLPVPASKADAIRDLLNENS